MSVIDDFWVRLGFKTNPEGLDEFKAKAEGAKKAMIEVGAAVAGVALGVTEFVRSAVEKLAGIQEFAEVTQMSAHEVASLGKLAKENGGSLEGMEQTIRSLTETTGLAARGIGRGAMIFAKLGLHAKDAKGNVKDFGAILANVADLMQGKSRAEQLGIAARLGIDEHLVGLLSKGSDHLQQLIDTAEKANPLTEKDYENALVTERLFKKVSSSVGLVQTQIAVKLLPTVDKALTAFLAWLKGIKAETWDGITRSIQKLVGAIQTGITWVAELAKHTTALKVIFGVLVAYKLGETFEGIAAGISKASKATVLFKNILLGGLLGALYLIIDDLWGFYHGQKSITGELVKKWPWAIHVVKAAMYVLAGAFLLIRFQAARTFAVVIAGWIRLGLVSAAAGLRAAAAWALANAPLIGMIALFAAAFYGGYKLAQLFDRLIQKNQKLAEALGLRVKEPESLKKFKAPSDFRRHQTEEDSDRPDFLKPKGMSWSDWDASKKGGHPSAHMSRAPAAIVERGGNHTTVKSSKVDYHVREVNITTNDPAKMGREFHRQVTRNGQSQVGL